MQRKRCFTVPAVILAIATATFTRGRIAAGYPLDGEPGTAGTYHILHVFTSAKEPTGNLIFDRAGNLYGTTFGGGSARCDAGRGGCGVVWKLAHNPGETLLTSCTYSTARTELDLILRG